ncbi:MAG: hypothetical protein Kow0042_16220 [Calditrichia bacterium]
MKRIQMNILLISLLFMAVSVFAQPRRPQQQPPRLPDAKEIAKMTEELAAAIQLTEEQKTEINKLFSEHFKEVGKRMENRKGRREERRQEMDKLKSEFEAKVKALLNEEQQAGFEQFMKAHTPQPGRNRPRQ